MSHLPNMLADATSGQNDLGVRGLWLAIIALSAFVVALLAGILKWFAERQTSTAGAPAPAFDSSALASAVLHAGVAFGGTFTMLSLIYYFLIR